MKVGDIYSSNNCGDFEIIKIYSWKKVEVKFLSTNFIKFTDAKSIMRGCIKDRYYPTVLGVGYLGEGPFKTKDWSKRKMTKEYSVWTHMLRRCYNPSVKDYRWYGAKGVKVCDEWLNFQNFAKWYNDNYIEDGQLDKDLLCGESKIYSPDNCVIIPQGLNKFLADKFTENSSIHKNRSGRYTVSVCNPLTKTNEYLGIFDSIQEATPVRNAFKKEMTVNLANYYFAKGDIDERIYYVLLNLELY